MSYNVSCECGTTIPVAATDAGSPKACRCGRTVEVPTLRELRRGAGEAVARTPELLIPALVQSGELPGPAECANCGAPTERVVHVRADCEQSRLSAPGFWQDVVFHTLFGWLAGLAMNRRDEENARVVGYDVEFDLPIRVCEGCRPGLKGRTLRETVRRKDVYALLLDKYPKARLSVVGEAAGGSEASHPPA